jgi:Tol biopolymer transport system component
MSGVDSPIDFSPTGDRFSFVRFNQAAGEYALMLAGVDGTGERILAKRRDGNTFSVFGPAWSPDGNSIACAAGWWDNGYHMKLVEVDVGNGHERAFGEQQWNLISRVAWLPGLKDQKEKRTDLIVCAREQWTSPYQLWRVSSAHGAAVRLTNDTTQHEQVSLSRDGNTLVTVTSHQIAQVWIAPDGDERRAKAITANVGLVYGLNWTSDGRIVFSSMAGNLLNISVINADGSTPVQLTENAGDNYTPVVSPDGRFIVFASNRNGSLNIWRMNAEDGSEPKQLTFSDSNSYPACSGDGQWVVYDNQSKAAFTVWKVPIDGGSPVQIVENARMPVVSPDGQFIACRHYLSAGLKEVAIFPFRGGLPVNQVPIPIVDWQRVQWSANGRALSYIDSSKGADNIWSYDLASASTRRLTDFKSDQIYAYAWSPDHKQLACERGAQVRDVTIIRNQR